MEADQKNNDEILAFPLFNVKIVKEIKFYWCLVSESIWLTSPSPRQYHTSWGQKCPEGKWGVSTWWVGKGTLRSLTAGKQSMYVWCEKPPSTHSYLVLVFFLGAPRTLFPLQNYVTNCGQWAVCGDDVDITLGLQHLRVGVSSPHSFSPLTT